MNEAFKEFEATSLFCTRCRRATPVQTKLLLVLPSGNKYDYSCSECGAQVVGKTRRTSMRPRPPGRRAGTRRGCAEPPTMRMPPGEGSGAAA